MKKWFATVPESCQPIKRLEDKKTKKKKKKEKKKKMMMMMMMMAVPNVAHNLQFKSNYWRTANVT